MSRYGRGRSSSGGHSRSRSTKGYTSRSDSYAKTHMSKSDRAAYGRMRSKGSSARQAAHKLGYR